MRHVRNVNTQLIAILRPRQRDRIIKILRILTVNRHRHQIAEILPPASLCPRNRIRQFLRLTDHVLRILDRQLHPTDHALHIDTGLIQVPQYLCHRTFGTTPLGRVRRNLQLNLLPVLCAMRLPLRDIEIRQFTVIRNHKGRLPVLVKRPDNCCDRTPQHTINLTLRLVSPARTLFHDNHLDGIPVHRSPGQSLRYKNIIFEFLNSDKPETLLRPHIHPGVYRQLYCPFHV